MKSGLTFKSTVIVAASCLLIAAGPATAASLHNSSSSQAQPAQSCSVHTHGTLLEAEACLAKGTKPASTKPQSKSVLDAEVLESPLSFFKNFSASEDEDSDAAPQVNALIITVKALVATLLSTII